MLQLHEWKILGCATDSKDTKALRSASFLSCRSLWRRVPRKEQDGCKPLGSPAL